MVTELFTSPLNRQERLRLAETVKADGGSASEPYLYQCLTGRRDMNPAEALRIERLTNGWVTRKELCRKTWRGIWPELDHGSTSEAE